MKKFNMVYWRDGERWSGYLQGYPEYIAQGETFEELQRNLQAIYNDIIADRMPFAAMMGELVLT
jgi:hypothetical protein